MPWSRKKPVVHGILRVDQCVAQTVDVVRSHSAVLQLCKDRFGGIKRRIEHVLRVCGGDEAGLEGRWCEVHAAIQHAVKKTG